MIKYLIHDGYVRSENDSERHFISGEKLVSLYKLKRSECGIIRHKDPRARLGFRGNYIHLHPRSNGNYDIIPE